MPNWGAGHQWPRRVSCPYCYAAETAADAAEELAFWRANAPCFPAPTRDALEAGWGHPGVHGGGRDPISMDVEAAEAWIEEPDGSEGYPS